MYYVGLDAHKNQFVMCVLDEGGKVVCRKTIRGGIRALLRALRALRRRIVVVFEASQGAGFLRDELRRVAKRVVVANPSRTALIFKSKRKNDRTDAQSLAKLLILDMVPEAYIPEEATRLWRETIEQRRRLLKRRTATKNAIRAFLRARGFSGGRGLWSRAGLAWFEDLPFENPLATARRDVLLKRLRDAETDLRAMTKALDAYAKGHAGMSLLMTIPGVGPRTAEAVMAYIDDPTRFRRSCQIGTYFGLVPQQDQSASVNRLGHITRQGPSAVRWLLTEAVWQGIRRSPRLLARYERHLRGDPQRRKIAAVATAHHLARVMLTMLKTGEVWSEAA